MRVWIEPIDVVLCESTNPQTKVVILAFQFQSVVPTRGHGLVGPDFVPLGGRRSCRIWRISRGRKCRWLADSLFQTVQPLLHLINCAVRIEAGGCRCGRTAKFIAKPSNFRILLIEPFE